MTRGRAVILVVLPSLAAGGAALLGYPLGGIRLRLYLIVVVAVVLAALVSDLAEAIPPAPPSVFERAMRRRPPAAHDRPAALIEVENLLSGRLRAGDVHFRLRPLVRELAASRLRTAYGLDLDRDTEASRRLLGAATWELVRPDREPPPDRFAAELDLPALRQVVEALESVAWR